MREEKSRKVDVTRDSGFASAVKKLNEGGSFGGAGLAAKDQNETRMGDILRFGHEVFPVASDDHITPFGGVAQNGRIICGDGKDITEHNNFVPQRAGSR